MKHLDAGHQHLIAQTMIMRLQTMTTTDPQEAVEKKEESIKRVELRRGNLISLASMPLSSIRLLTHRMHLMRTKSMSASHVMGAIL